MCVCVCIYMCVYVYIYGLDCLMCCDLDRHRHSTFSTRVARASSSFSSRCFLPSTLPLG